MYVCITYQMINIIVPHQSYSRPNIQGESILARLDKVQEELLYYPGVGLGGGALAILKVLR